MMTLIQHFKNYCQKIKASQYMREICKDWQLKCSKLKTTYPQILWKVFFQNIILILIYVINLHLKQLMLNRSTMERKPSLLGDPKYGQLSQKTLKTPKRCHNFSLKSKNGSLGGACADYVRHIFSIYYRLHNLINVLLLFFFSWW